MSCYEWERGTIKLPTAEAKKFRDTIKRAVDDHRTRLYDMAQEFWKGLPAKAKRDEKLYRTHVRIFVHGNMPGEYDYNDKFPATRGKIVGNENYNGFGYDLEGLLTYTVLSHYEPNPDYPDKPYAGKNVANGPRRVKQTDVDRITEKPTGVKFTVQCGEPQYRIDGRSVTWDVPENNHACEHGREHPLAQVLFAALDRVNWTRGSGGTIVGNNEYNEGDYEGAGGNYVVQEFGPKVKRPTRYGRW